MKAFIAALGLIILTGCSTVVLNSPFPDSQLTPEEQEQLSGTWLQDNTVGHVRFTGNGVPWLAGVEWKDDDFRLEKTRLHFTKRNDTLYVCMPVEPDQGEGYLFGEIKPGKDEVYVWGPDAGFFAQQVKSGILKGTAEQDKNTISVSLETPPAEILELISTNRAAIDYRNPLIIRKLK